MTTPRPVSFGTFWSLLRERGPLGVLGVVFMAVSLLVLVPLLLFITTVLREPYEKYDYPNIVRHGTAATARLTDVRVLRNVQVNGESPRLLTYAYASGGQTRTDQFATFDLGPASGLAPGDTLGIRVLDGESVVPTLAPFRFPFWVFLFLPGIFLLVSVPFLLIGLLPALRKYRLYRHGLVQEGTVLGIRTQPVRLSRFNVVQRYALNYEYAGLHQARHVGEDTTDDLLLINEKKLGDRVKILVSAQDEATSCLWPRLEALKNGWQE